MTEINKSITNAIVIIKIPYGHLSGTKAQEYIDAQKASIKDNLNLPENFKYCFIPIDFNTAQTPYKHIEILKLDEDTDTNDIEKLINSKEKSKLVNVRISDKEKSEMLDKANKYGFKNLSDYLRFVGLNAELKVVVPHQEE